MTSRPVPPAPRCCRTKKEPADETPRPDPSMTSPAAAVAAACHRLRAAMPLDLMPSGRNPIVFGSAADSPRLPHARFLPLLIFQQQNARGYYTTWLCGTKQTQVACTRLAAVRIIAKCADMFPLVSDYTHICFLLDLLLQLLLKLLLLLLSRIAHSHAVRLRTPIRCARRGCPRLNSHRGASAAALLASLRRDTTLPACSYAFTIGKVRRWWYSSPPCSTFGGWRVFPTGLPLCPALECWSSSQPAPQEQGPYPHP